MEQYFKLACDTIVNGLTAISKQRKAKDVLWFIDKSEKPFSFDWCLEMCNLRKSVILSHVDDILKGKKFSQIILDDKINMINDIRKFKECVRCGKVRAISQYYISTDKRGKSYLGSECKNCRSDMQKAQYYKNKSN